MVVLTDWRRDMLHWLAGAGIARLCEERHPGRCSVGWRHGDRHPDELVVEGVALAGLARWVGESRPDLQDLDVEPRRILGWVLIGGRSRTEAIVGDSWQGMQALDIAAELTGPRTELPISSHRWVEHVGAAYTGTPHVPLISPVLQHLGWLGARAHQPTMVGKEWRLPLAPPGTPAAEYSTPTTADRTASVAIQRAGGDRYRSHASHFGSLQ